MHAAITAGSLQELSQRIEAIRQLPEAHVRLVALLHEQAPLYAGRRTAEVEEFRGRILASFETQELPPDAVPVVLEELETGIYPSTVAAAGRALRGTAALPAEAPTLLVEAISRLRGRDEVVLAAFAPNAEGRVTALEDLAATLAFLGPRARSALPAMTLLLDQEGENLSTTVHATLATAAQALTSPAPDALHCCASAPAASQAATESGGTPASAASLGGLELENQDGERLTLAKALAGQPTALAFFYTRCTNPDKCSLTVTRLARLAQLADKEGLAANVAGISYDPRFDRPGRLKSYGSDRGMRFSETCSLLRTTGPLEPLLDALELGVGFGPVTVNRHRLELFVLDGSLHVTEKFERRLWSEETVLDALRRAARSRRTRRPADEADRLDGGNLELGLVADVGATPERLVTRA